jgi:hypothetical protein
MPPVALTEQEQRLWDRIGSERGHYGTPQAVCSTITPFPFWGVVAAIVIFIPLALVASFWLKRQALVVQGSELVVVELSFWRTRQIGEPLSYALGAAAVSHEGNALVIDGSRYHLQPGWGDPAKRIAELAG